MTELQEGTPVRYFPGFRDGPSHLGKVRYSGLAVIGGTPGYYISGAGFISAAHIEVLPVENGAIEVKTASEALEVCTWDGVTDVVITDNAERIKMQKLIRGLR
jgi:hypothetical protein